MITLEQLEAIEYDDFFGVNQFHSDGIAIIGDKYGFEEYEPGYLLDYLGEGPERIHVQKGQVTLAGISYPIIVKTAEKEQFCDWEPDGDPDWNIPEKRKIIRPGSPFFVVGCMILSPELFFNKDFRRDMIFSELTAKDFDVLHDLALDLYALYSEIKACRRKAIVRLFR